MTSNSEPVEIESTENVATDNSFAVNSSSVGATAASDYPRSSAMQKSPTLSHRSLTQVLIGMGLMPIVTISALWMYMPPLFEGQLDCRFTAEALPTAEFYAVDYRERPDYDGGFLVVENREDQDWTHLNIQVNGHYQIYDTDPIPAGETVKFKLDRFVSRAGSRFQLRYNELKSARIYARRPSRDRATFYCEFENGEPVAAE
jgi:hypothetical protein